MTRVSNSQFLRACRGEQVDHIPIWIMRQAGRYMPAYQALRKKHDFLTMCHEPELSAEVTMQPINEFGFDAAIIFSDILIPFEPMGIKVDFVDGKGPQLSPQLKTKKQIEALHCDEILDKTRFVGQALKLVRSELSEDKALIGFCGAPWTMACYGVEGMGSRNYAVIKRMMNSEPVTLHLLLDKLADVLTEYLKMQLDSGADAVQIFESWAEALSPEDYLEFAYPYVKKILDGLKDYSQPKIFFSKDAGAFTHLNVDLAADVLAIDWRVNLAAKREIFADRKKAFQGNLDPLTLLGEPEIMLAKAEKILEENAGRPGFIFNLGHGITPPTPVENVRTLVNFVQNYKVK